MYKRHKIIAVLIFLVFSLISYFTHISYNNEFVSNSVTFLSILIGFTITSLSLLFSSSTVKNFYDKVDGENHSITQLHRLKNYYKTSILISVSSVAVFLFLTLLQPEFLIYHILLGTIAVNIYLFIILFLFFLNLFVYENSRK